MTLPHIEAQKAHVRSTGWLSSQSKLSLLIVIGLPLLTRLVLLPWYPIPKPSVADEFSHLLVADTFASGRIVNPPHPFPEHFETEYEFQRPVYTSKYPPGHGLVMAIGQALAGHPWWGIWGSTGLMCGAVFWMLLGWVELPWAFLGGLICAWRFALFTLFINSYMGGSATALAGALALGALPRLMKTGKPVWSFVLASGLGFISFIRPFESVLYAFALGAVLVVWLARTGWKTYSNPWLGFVVPILAVAALTAGGHAYYNFRVTGNAMLMPYQLHQRMYGTPRGFSSRKPMPEPVLQFQDLRDVYEWQYRTFIGNRYRLKTFGRYYFGIPLAPALVFLLFARRTGALYLAAICVVVFGGSFFYWWFMPHYMAPLVGACVALQVLGLRELWNRPRVWPMIGRYAVGALLLGMMFEFTMREETLKPPFFYAYEDARSSIEAQLSAMGGQHLIFVHYGPMHNFQVEWIYNRADIDASNIIWAREVSPESDAALANHYSGRSAWTVDADAAPVKLEKWCCRTGPLSGQAPAESSKPPL
jgi:hypothetical protein